MSAEGTNFVTVRSLLPTSPLPPNSERATVTTHRLIIRALQATDLEALYALRRQEDVMQWTAAGRIDRYIEETRSKLNLFLPPNDAASFNCAICLKETGEFIGVGGCHLFLRRMDGQKLDICFDRNFGAVDWGLSFSVHG
ncbi:uncharacterized protein N7477_007842 [Penicillium maclennaniae]|uniref:uncharacterized protein n=1 Tax=Penicillium maclennaniae TaxID=1343394 RepID=UPI00253F7033|nr:uncharacterized protein N7477_007842 [Penicillium maclennaniae]KAJ5665394.1 hypothetical protein N7477_007842 [Penicillium maclennaniae]